MLAAMASALAGCSTLSSMNPVNWWHRQEGGKIAEQRPAPPGADQPYPNLSTVPAKPEPPNADDLKKLTDSLVADRTNAQHAAQSAPLADPSSPSASPGLFGVGTAPRPPPPGATPSPGAASAPGGSPVASASMPAVTAPPAPATPPSPAPRKPVQSAPLDAPAASAPAVPVPAPAVPSAPAPSASAAPPPAAPPPAPSPAAATQAGPPPALPAGPPARPAAAGIAPPPPVVPVPMPAPSAAPSATIVFLDKAANLGPPEADEVKAFAAKRGDATISVIGYGDSVSGNPEAQSAALNLGLSRAQSIVDVLKAAGVPGTAIRVSAEASGRGALLQLLK